MQKSYRLIEDKVGRDVWRLAYGEFPDKTVTPYASDDYAPSTIIAVSKFMFLRDVELFQAYLCNATEAYEKGYEKGYEEGYEEGYNRGNEKGYEEGYEEGYNRGYKDGSAEVLND